MKRPLLILGIGMLVVLACSGAFVYQLCCGSYFSAVRQIETAVAGDYETLDLRTMAIGRLPPEIGNATSLTALFLAHTELSALPPELGNLSILKSLGLSGNRLTSLPAVIGELTALEYLNLSSNQLTSLPPEIGNLDKLTEIDLSGNPFDAPQAIISQGDWAIFDYYANR